MTATAILQPVSVRTLSRCLGLCLISLLVSLALRAEPASVDAKWEQTGWGGGGYFYAAAYHPTREGVVYLGGDVAGIYKSEDHGRTWRMINNGLVNYAVFSLAVDPSNPDTVYAATQGGLCKSIDAGETWVLLEQTGPKHLKITGRKKKSIRSVAVDPSDSDTVYAGSPDGNVYKSEDGGITWEAVYTGTVEGAEPGRLRIQFGKINGDYYGGIWTPLQFPESVKSGDAVGFGFNFKGDGSVPKSFAVYLRGEGMIYKSRELNELFADEEARDVVLRAEDFAVDPKFAREHPEKAAALPATPDWSAITRVDVSGTGDFPRSMHVASLTGFFIAAVRTADGVVGSPEEPVRVTMKELGNKSRMHTYGNVRLGDPVVGPVYTVAVSESDPARVAAATHNDGVLLSRDRGETWTSLPTPDRVSSVDFDPKDADILYGTFFTDGIWKSADGGTTWEHLTAGIPADHSLLEVAVSPGNSSDLVAIGHKSWDGQVFRSRDGGQTWQGERLVKPDYAANPTLPAAGEQVQMSILTNIAIDPHNPEQIFLSANWRCMFSGDGGVTWEERIRGADISCITDIQFRGDRTYVTAMDEGTLVSEDNGTTWRQLWPLDYSETLSGHYWRVRVTTHDGVDRILSTASPWGGPHAQLVVRSEDGGKSYEIVTEGLPDYRITANTMWERGFPRALAVDPSDPDVVYLGIDGNATEGRMGGGVFKSTDGGRSWAQLPNQPSSRRMYYGLAIDPTETSRIYWAAFGSGGGVYRSEDAGASWERVFRKDQYLFNLITTPDGTVYAGGKQLYRSRDQGKTWATLTDIPGNKSIVGIEVHPEDPDTIWISANVWSHDAAGAIYKSTDGGGDWVDITGDIPFNHPQVLRFNPETRELWAGYVGLYKLRQ